jgi:murein DD-endopeptidase MepM/ murein hydrolase activator NlpD
VSGAGFVRPGAAGKLGVTAIVAVLAFSAGRAAAATTGGAGTPGAAPTAKGSPTGIPSSAPSAGNLTILAAETTPHKSFYFGYRYPKLTFTIGSSQPENDLEIDVLDSNGEVVKTFYRENVAPDVAGSVRWDGTTNEGRPARNGRYTFRISPQSAAAPAPAARKATASTALSLGFAFYAYAFPVLGPHEFGMGAGRFGAPRSGHTHQGQDVMAACGTPLVAARGGTVQYAGYEANAGNYVVIDGRGTPDDFMYAHLAEPSPLHTGETVRTGQPIGLVGETGDAVGCHLHFEMWGAPG